MQHIAFIKIITQYKRSKINSVARKNYVSVSHDHLQVYKSHLEVNVYFNSQAIVFIAWQRNIITK